VNAATAAEIQPRIVHVLAELLNRAPAALRPERLLTEFDFDSLDRAELAMELEDEFSVVLSDDEVLAIDTVQSVFDLVARKVAA
jgi:acyl carrier protein